MLPRRHRGVELWATFGTARDWPLAGVAETFGQLTIYREVAVVEECQRTVVLGDRSPALLGEPWVRLVVKRSGPLSGQPVQIGGRSAKVYPGDSDNPGLCQVDLVQRSYQGASGNPRVEMLGVIVFLGAEQPTDAACRSATALAEAAGPKLPPDA